MIHIFTITILLIQFYIFHALPGYRSAIQGWSQGDCYRIANTTVSYQTTVSDLDNWKFDPEILRQLGIPDWKASFSTEPNMLYFQNNKEDDFSLTYHVYVKISRWVSVSYTSGNSLMTTYANDLFRARNKTNFLMMCGDSLVDAFEEGAILIISVRVNFRTASDKIRFNEERKPTEFLNDTLLHEQYPGVQVTITGFQRGGDPSQLFLALPTIADRCDISMPGECLKSLENLLVYAQQEFPQQLTSSSQSSEDPFVLLGGVIKGPYLTDMGYADIPSEVTPESFKAGKDLLETYENMLNLKAGFEKLLATGLIPEVASENLQVVQENLDLFFNGPFRPAIYCWLTPSACVTIAENIKNSLQEVAFVPQETKVCGKPEDANITLDIACSNLKGTYINLEWKNGTWLNDGLPNENGDCVAMAVGNQKTLDGTVPVPCEKQTYLPINLVNPSV